MKLLTSLLGCLLTANVMATESIIEKPDITGEVIGKPEIFQAIATGYNVELTGSNHISVVGPISSATASDFISSLTNIDDKEVVIYLDSPGGSVIAGNSMITALKDSGKKSICVAKFAASMAFGILQACDERYLTRDGVIMQHEMSYGVQGPAPQNRSLVNLLERIGLQMDLFQAERLGLSYGDFKYKTIRDYWLFSQDAVTDKAADGLASISCSERLVKQRVIRTIRLLFWNIDVYMSACPLLTKMEPVNKPKRELPTLESLKTPSMIKKLNGGL